jgi:hypothetical protein
MAAFTTMALLGLAGATGMFAGRKLAPKPTGATTAAPVTPTPTTAPPPPVPASQSASQNTSQAQLTAKKLRRRMTGNTPGSYSTPGQSLITPTVQPRTLLGY